MAERWEEQPPSPGNIGPGRNTETGETVKPLSAEQDAAAQRSWWQRFLDWLENLLR